MNSSDIEAIRQLISRAKQHELKTGKLDQLLTEELPHLHRAIRLPDDNAVTALMDLVINYIESVPDCITAIDKIAHEAGISEYTDTFLNIAKDYFVHPPELLNSDDDMASLMSEAYLAHRLMEEINDRFIGHCGMPLAPMDMTMSNLIVHELIGEPFANELDMAVQFSLELCSPKEGVFQSQDFKIYVERRRKDGYYNVLDDWPCMTEDKAITLEFSNLSDYADALSSDPKKSAIH